MTGAQLAASLKMTEGVRWYDWVGRTSCGKIVRAQSRSMVRSPLSTHVSEQFVKVVGGK